MLNDIFFTVFLFESLALQGSEKKLLAKGLACSTPSSDSLPVPPWEALAVDTGNGYHLLQDIDGGSPRGRYRRVWQCPPLSLMMT
jgi:hypothetical protein